MNTYKRIQSTHQGRVNRGWSLPCDVKPDRNAKELTHVELIEDAKKVTRSVFDYYTANATPKERIGDFTDRIGFEEFAKFRHSAGLWL